MPHLQSIICLRELPTETGEAGDDELHRRITAPAMI
jgi:hypothetical protein